MDIEHRYQMIFFNLPDEMLNIIGDLDNLTINRLKSKKNLVFDIYTKDHNNYILKYFRSKKADNEYHTLSHLNNQNLNVPSIIDYEKPYLLLEKIHEVNFCDFINKPLINKNNLSEIDTKLRRKLILGIKFLSKWFAHFHKSNLITHKENEKTIVLNKGDTRLRDFIIDIDSKIIYGVDFEESYEGNYLDDLAWICCSLIDTNPGLFELEDPYHKIELMNEFLKQYYKINNYFHFSFSYFADAFIEALNTVIKRRGLIFGKLDKKRILDNLTREF